MRYVFLEGDRKNCSFLFFEPSVSNSSLGLDIIDSNAYRISRVERRKGRAFLLRRRRGKDRHHPQRSIDLEDGLSLQGKGDLHPREEYGTI